MKFLTLPTLRKSCASLCVALMCVFTAAASASAVNTVQHAFGSPTSHEHMPFSNISLDDEDHHSTKHYGHGDHHHHGDIGAGLTLLLSDVAALPPDGTHHALARDSVRTDVRHSLPERPPRA
ncbi:MAG: hypothetical protein V4601_10030 [Pseudomonadota bacterium]